VGKFEILKLKKGVKYCGPEFSYNRGTGDMGEVYGGSTGNCHA